MCCALHKILARCLCQYATLIWGLCIVKVGNFSSTLCGFRTLLDWRRRRRRRFSQLAVATRLLLRRFQSKGSIGPEHNVWFRRLLHPLMSLDGKSLDESSIIGVMNQSYSWSRIQINRNQKRIHSCSPGQRETLIHESYFWGPRSNSFSHQRNRMRELTKSVLCAWGYSGDWAG